MKTLMTGFAILLFSPMLFASDGTVSENLFVFVGEFRSIEEYESPMEGCGGFDEEGNELICITMDMGFKAVYEIKKVLHGEYNSNIIEFIAFDHYGYPDFAQYKYALLYVSEHDGRMYHEKYQYADVYPTHDGQWAACDDWNRGDMEPLPLESIRFSPPLTFDVSTYNKHYAQIAYPSPIYRIDDDKAVCMKGLYAEDLFEIKKQTVLKARGLVE